MADAPLLATIEDQPSGTLDRLLVNIRGLRRRLELLFETTCIERTKMIEERVGLLLSELALRLVLEGTKTLYL